mmetsp:Transcript_80880/g.135274  ORF Transcript_80880/g.135274 Transcript_80880/m.135274 type:complete len:92 (-) Transcript_80880:128-403(-)
MSLFRTLAPLRCTPSVLYPNRAERRQQVGRVFAPPITPATEEEVAVQLTAPPPPTIPHCGQGCLSFAVKRPAKRHCKALMAKWIGDTGKDF